GLSLKAHPVSVSRDRLTPLRAVRTGDLADPDTFPNRRRVAVAGVVLGRQRPATAKGILFITIEDETGPANLIIRPRIFEQFRHAARQSVLLLVRGHVERQGIVLHVIARTLEDVSHLLVDLNTPSRDFH
ncbi:MAG: OB-fold nucleic acid binding domain-containing protein, partial [Phycisphaerales bacterium]